jgi:hypothetical protein
MSSFSEFSGWKCRSHYLMLSVSFQGDSTFCGDESTAVARRLTMLRRMRSRLSAFLISLILMCALSGCGDVGVGVGYDEGPYWDGGYDYYDQYYGYDGGGWRHDDYHHFNAFHAEGGHGESERGFASLSGGHAAGGMHGGGGHGGGGGHR